MTKIQTGENIKKLRELRKVTGDPLQRRFREKIVK